jgi:hypothetical protein
MTKRHDKFVQPIDGIVVVSRAAGPGVHRGNSGRTIRSTESAPELTNRERAFIVAKIRPIFDDTTRRFDNKKYSPEIYAEVLTEFERPTRVSPGTLRSALLWKYGHLGKRGQIPVAHRNLIAEVQRAWPHLARDLGQAPDQTFTVIERRVGGPTRFITVAFLLHLIHPRRVPIIDQHNFRAVNSFISDVRPTWQAKRKPSGWSDIMLVASFMEAVISTWRQQEPSSIPTPRQLDQFLMRYGKDLKARHNNRLQPSAAGAIMGRRG